MNKLDLIFLNKEFNVQLYNKRITSIPLQGWFFLKTNPKPPKSEIKNVVIDIIMGNDVGVYEGKVRHSNKCNEKHIIPIDKKYIEQLLDKINDETFYVAIHPGHPDILYGQPIAIGVEPEINYFIYPEHPHINSWRIEKLKGGQQYFIPCSLCYTDKPNRLCKNSYERLKKTFAQVTIWLFRYQVWKTVLKINKQKDGWIGPANKEEIAPEIYSSILHPQLRCHCSSGKMYKDCHLPYDIPVKELDEIMRNNPKLDITNAKKRQIIIREKVIVNVRKDLDIIMKDFKNALNEVKNNNVMVIEDKSISQITI